MTPVAPYVQTPHLTVGKWSTKVYKDIHIHCMCKGNLIKYYIHIFILGLQF